MPCGVNGSSKNENHNTDPTVLDQGHAICSKSEHIIQTPPLNMLLEPGTRMPAHRSSSDHETRTAKPELGSSRATVS